MYMMKHVSVLYLPQNTKSYMQPWDQGIIHNIKHAHQKHSVHYYLWETVMHVTMTEIRSDAIRTAAVPWNSQNCFANKKAVNKEQKYQDDSSNSDPVNYP